MQYRFSIPFVGGICAVLTEEEVKAKTAKVKASIVEAKKQTIKYAIIGADYSTHKAADGLFWLANKVASFHDNTFPSKEDDLSELDRLIAQVGARKEQL